MEDKVGIERCLAIFEEIEIHHCFVCSRQFNPDLKDCCPVCGFLKCPDGHCACNLTREARIAVENFFKTYCNPCPGGKRRSR